MVRRRKCGGVLEMNRSSAHYASKAYANVAKDVAVLAKPQRYATDWRPSPPSSALAAIEIGGHVLALLSDHVEDVWIHPVVRVGHCLAPSDIIRLRLRPPHRSRC